MSRQNRGIAPRDLIMAAIEGVETARKRILHTLIDLDENPDKTETQFSRRQHEDKELIQMDSTAEELCRDLFNTKFEKDIQFVGEESLASFTSWGTERYCILVDMVDGTDLVEMNLGLWCSAIVIYDLHEREIIGSVVGLPSGEIYYAERDRSGAWVRVKGQEYEVDGCSSVVDMKDARIAYYGQKPINFLSLSDNEHFTEALRKLSGEKFLRLYNFAGNPMMVRLCNRPKSSVGKTITSGIDVVLDLVGQQLHDVVPGAFIAMKGGAHLHRLDGSPISYAEMGEALHNPKNTMTYVLAATEQLAASIVEALDPSE